MSIYMSKCSRFNSYMTVQFLPRFHVLSLKENAKEDMILDRLENILVICINMQRKTHKFTSSNSAVSISPAAMSSASRTQATILNTSSDSVNRASVTVELPTEEDGSPLTGLEAVLERARTSLQIPQDVLLNVCSDQPSDKFVY